MRLFLSDVSRYAPGSFAGHAPLDNYYFATFFIPRVDAGTSDFLGHFQRSPLSHQALITTRFAIATA
jgi:hypothetical protein